MLPEMLAHECGKDAAILYAYLLADCDSAGIVEATYGTAWKADLSRDEIDAALKVLVQKGYIETFMQRVPIAKIGRGYVYGRQPGCRLLKFTMPLRHERLSPGAWAALRSSVFERDDYTCHYCGERGRQLECDHIEPISKGGTNEMGNLVTACAACNRRKRSKALEEWRNNASA